MKNTGSQRDSRRRSPLDRDGIQGADAEPRQRSDSRGVAHRGLGGPRGGPRPQRAWVQPDEPRSTLCGRNLRSFREERKDFS